MSIVKAGPSLQLTQLTGDHWLRRDWLTGKTHPIRLDEMTPRDRARLLAGLRRNALIFQRQELSVVASLRDNGILTADEAAARVHTLNITPAGRWLEQQPLVARLRELVEQPAQGAA
ncbi:hypothetical protein [Pseudonocardia sp.]|uniref:hypothetical protein n=1 Tax=Pseudonocardia sp. TaxID=60912 RepID=UPI003D0BF6B7